MLGQGSFEEPQIQGAWLTVTVCLLVDQLGRAWLCGACLRHGHSRAVRTEKGQHSLRRLVQTSCQSTKQKAAMDKDSKWKLVRRGKPQTKNTPKTPPNLRSCK